jgi:demethylmenaquinone methyltransferase/2-methoxy-6-polyprenyl-1,4-benzoquinol methylase
MKQASYSLHQQFAEQGGKPQYVRRLFGRIARVYDLLNRLISFGQDRRWRRFAARQVGLGPDQVALDLGTGTGDLAIAVLHAGAPGCRVVGVDFTSEMLAIGRRKLDRLGLSDRIELIQGDADQLPFADNAFDACCSAFVVRNLADIGQSFREMWRVVKPGGKVVCLELSHPPGLLFSPLYYLYFDRIVPILGKLIGKAFREYLYLPQSLAVFPAAPQLKAIMEAAGWANVRYYYLTFGVVAVHVGEKRG